MKIALVEPYIVNDSLRSYAENPEPSHLVGMYNRLRSDGFDVEIIDAYREKLSPAVLAERIQGQGVTHAGFTVYDYDPCIEYMQEVMQGLPRTITTIAGGPAATYSTRRVAGLVGVDWIVKQDGEEAILRLAKSYFSHDTLKPENVNGSKVLVGAPVHLDQMDFFRPYSLEKYGYEAAPRIQKGCIGKCIFCLGAYQKEFEYLSKERAREHFQYLVSDKRARVISPSGPDFTTLPKQVNPVVEALLDVAGELQGFRPGVRLDSLYRSIQLAPDIWKELGLATDVLFEGSIESFSYTRLVRLGKGVGRRFESEVIEQIERILEACRSRIVLGRIALDPTISLEEFVQDSKGFIRLLELFPDQVTVGGMLMNEFVPLWGTPSMEDTGFDNPWARRGDLLDPLVAELKRRLLDHEKFRLWCRLAEKVPDFAERNRVFREILRVTVEEARSLAARPYLKGTCASRACNTGPQSPGFPRMVGG